MKNYKKNYVFRIQKISLIFYLKCCLFLLYKYNEVIRRLARSSVNKTQKKKNRYYFSFSQFNKSRRRKTTQPKDKESEHRIGSFRIKLRVREKKQITKKKFFKQD